MQKKNSVRTDGADRRPNILARNEDLVTSRDHTPRFFASFRVAAKRVVVDALLNLEGADRFGWVGGFVNVSRHRDDLLVNGLGAFLFGEKKNSSPTNNIR